MLISIWDADSEGEEIADEIVSRNVRYDRGIGHSQGVRICLEGVYQAAEKCKELSDNGMGCCRKEKKIRLVLAAPKTSSGYIDEIYKDVKEIQPGWQLDILVIYSSGDWLVPNSDLFPIPGNYDPTEYAASKYMLFKIHAPFPAHSSGPMLGDDVTGAPSQGVIVEDVIRSFLK